METLALSAKIEDVLIRRGSVDHYFFLSTLAVVSGEKQWVLRIASSALYTTVN